MRDRRFGQPEIQKLRTTDFLLTLTGCFDGPSGGSVPNRALQRDFPAPTCHTGLASLDPRRWTCRRIVPACESVNNQSRKAGRACPPCHGSLLACRSHDDMATANMAMTGGPPANGPCPTVRRSWDWHLRRAGTSERQTGRSPAEGTAAGQRERPYRSSQPAIAGTRNPPAGSRLRLDGARPFADGARAQRARGTGPNDHCRVEIALVTAPSHCHGTNADHGGSP